MAKPAGFEDFEDEDYGSLGGGFGGAGSATGGSGSLDNVQTKLDARGIHSKCLCEHCGTNNQLTAEWPEAIAGSLELCPPNWHVAPGGYLYAYVGCSKCGTELKVGYTPQEFKARVLQGIQQGAVTQAYVASQVASMKPPRR